MNSILFKNITESFISIFSNVKGFKALILDSETSAILSLVCTQTFLLENEVFLTLKLDDANVFRQNVTKSIVDIDLYDNKSDNTLQLRSDKQVNLKHIPSLFIIRPTNANIDTICTELSQGIFGSYYLFFTNTLTETQVDKLAKYDSYQLVKSVVEFYVDFYLISHNTFSLEQHNIINLYKPIINTELITLNSVELNKIFLSYYENGIVSRIVDGLFGLCFCIGKNPTIIYRKCSALCHAIASQLQAKLNDHNNTISQNVNSKKSKDYRIGTVLLLYDRRDDCVTPLLTQWTYQAMIHEYIGINNNKILLNNENGEKEEFVISPITDPFFNKNKFLDYVDIETAINELVGTYKAKQNSIKKNDVFETIQLMSDQSKLSADVKRHVSVQHALNKFVEKSDLLNQSIFEQSICCDRNKADIFQELYNRVQSPNISEFDRLRLCCLFGLCNSDDVSLLKYLQSHMKNLNCSQSDFKTLENILKYSKSAMCKNTDRGFFSFAKNAFEQTIKDNVAYMRYNSRLSETIELLLQGKLDAFDYVTTPSAFGHQYSLNEIPKTVIAFAVGGATYQESRECHRLSEKTGIDILLGGTSFHNSHSFLEEMAK